jgi:hypothetical protein
MMLRILHLPRRRKSVSASSRSSSDLSGLTEPTQIGAVASGITDIQERNAGLPAVEVQALIEEACAAVRREFWPDRNW